MGVVVVVRPGGGDGKTAIGLEKQKERSKGAKHPKRGVQKECAPAARSSQEEKKKARGATGEGERARPKRGKGKISVHKSRGNVSSF